MHHQASITRVAVACTFQALLLATGCASSDGADPMRAMAADRMAPAVQLAGADLDPTRAGCRELLQVHHDAFEAGVSVHPRLTDTLAFDVSSAETAAVRVIPDVEMLLVDAAPGVRCVVQVSLPESFELVHREAGQPNHEIRDYLRARKTKANPAYSQAKKALEQADTETGEKFDLPPLIGHPTLDVLSVAAGGLMRGLDAWQSHRRSEQAREELAAIPSEIETAEYDTYTLEVRDVRIVKSAVLSIALDDRDGGTSLTTRHRVDTDQAFVVAENIHPRDRRQEERSEPLVVEAEVDAYEVMPISVRASTLVQALLASPPERTTASAATKTGALPRPLPGIAPEPERVVAEAQRAPAADEATSRSRHDFARSLPVQGAGGEGRGFFVSEGELVTTASALGGSSIANVSWPDGLRSMAILQRVDAQSGLALLSVPRNGTALPLVAQPGERLVTPMLDAQPGTPISAGEAIFAVVIEPANGKVVRDQDLVSAVARLRELSDPPPARTR